METDQDVKRRFEERLAIHEAGHVVMARHVGFVVNDVELHSGGGRSRISFCPINDSPTVSTSSRRRHVLVALAGMAAEMIKYGLKNPDDFADLFAKSSGDVQAVVEWLSIDSIDSPVLAEHLFETDSILRDTGNWRKCESLAASLLETRKLYQKQIYSILNEV